MKKANLIKNAAAALLAAAPLCVSAQALFTTREYLDVNRFKAIHMVHGDMWWDPTTNKPGCEYPQGTGKHASFLGNLWVTGYDAAGSLYASAVRYREEGSDYWPGPLDAAGATTYAESEKWARIWKINRSDVNHFLALGTRTIATIPSVILEWPAKGNVNAKGNAGAALTITTDMAPFVDTDHDGIYDPLKGDYPDMKGDQMLWWVFNDNLGTHVSSKGMAFQIEYHASAYAYNRGSAVDRMLFYEYELLNKSANQYRDFRIAFYSDADLGSPYDDAIAFDSSSRTGIEFNGNSYDAPNGANSYGVNTPMTGLSLVETPGDHYPATIIPAGTFNYFDLSASGARRGPNDAVSYFNYMHSMMYDGIRDPKLSGSYAYNLALAPACSTSEAATDRRYLVASGSYTFDAHSKTKFAYIFVATDTNGNNCAALNTKELTDLVDTAWKVYYTPLPTLSMHDPVAVAQKLNIYPSPARDRVFVDLANNFSLRDAVVYDIAGRRINVPFTQQGKQLQFDIRALSPGVYTLNCTGVDAQCRGTFVVQQQ